MQLRFFKSVMLVCMLQSSVLLAAGTVELRQVDDADCAERSGQLVFLVNTGKVPLTVWVDRWFMEVQTPDHTRHVLAPSEEHALGCSNTRVGEQHWSIAGVIPVE